MNRSLLMAACTLCAAMPGTGLRADPADDVLHQMRNGATMIDAKARAKAAAATITPTVAAYNKAVVDAYVAQVKASIIDEENHGGWPVRSWLMNQSSSRRAITSGLKGRLERSPEVIVAFAAICPALFAKDDALLQRALDYLKQHDPFLHERAQASMARYWRPYISEIHRKQAATSKNVKLEKDDPLSTLPR